ncbi:MAG: DUF262 domain-containing protein [Clostridia bacterium]
MNFDLNRFKQEKVAYTTENKKVIFLGTKENALICDIFNMWDNKSSRRVVYNEQGEYLTEFYTFQQWGTIDKFNADCPHYNLNNELNKDLKILELSDVEFKVNPNITVNKNLTICTAKELINNSLGKTFDFDVKLKNGKNLQRSLVWSDLQKQELILSILKEIYIPPITVVEVSESIRFRGERVIQIIDGKQRMTTVRDFLLNKFSINVNGIEYFYTDLSHAAKYKISSYSFVGTCYYTYKDESEEKYNLTDNDYINLFEYVNFSGTPVEKQHLLDLKNSL